MRDAFDVKAARGHVRRDQDGQLAVLEVVQDLEPLLLLDVAGQRSRVPAVSRQPVLEPPRFLPRVGEHQNAAAALALEEAQEQAELLLAARVIHHLDDVLGRLLRRRDGDLGGVVHELPRELQHPEGQRGREQERLALLGRRQPAQDEAQVGDEAHVEHPVGLVDHKDFHALGRPDVLLEIVDEAAGRADEDVARFAQVLALLVVVDAAVDGADLEPRVGAQQPGVGLDLHDQLARGRDDQDARRRRTALGRRGMPQAPREGRDQEGRRLARARLGLARHVLALERQRERALLDGRHGDEARVLDAAHDRLRQVEGPEVHGHGVAGVSAGGSAASLLRLLTARRAQMMPTSYRMQSGPAMSVWLIMSGVGVRIAATMKLMRMAYLRFLERNCGVTTPIRLRIVITTGSSKTSPKASANLITKSVYEDTVIIGFQPFSWPNVTRKFEA